MRQALSHSTPPPFPQSEGQSSVFTPAKQDLEVEFAEQFGQLQGKFIFCADHAELVSNLKVLITHFAWKRLYCREEKLISLLRNHQYTAFSNEDLGQCEAAITSCELLIARTGSIVLSSAQQSGRTVSVYAPIHICIAYSNQLVYDIKDGLQAMKEKYGGHLPSLITFATGPSRTADIEKTLVVGVHGPKEVYLFMVDSPS